MGYPLYNVDQNPTSVYPLLPASLVICASARVHSTRLNEERHGVHRMQGEEHVYTLSIQDSSSVPAFELQRVRRT
jgi:hypothetical protein